MDLRTNRHVTGEVRLRLFRSNAMAIGASPKFTFGGRFTFGEKFAFGRRFTFGEMWTNAG